MKDLQFALLLKFIEMLAYLHICIVCLLFAATFYQLSDAWMLFVGSLMGCISGWRATTCGMRVKFLGKELGKNE